MLNAEGRAILDFERAHWQEPGAKDESIEISLGLTAVTFYERLLELVDNPLALAYDPLTVKRVSKLIEEPLETELAG